MRTVTTEKGVFQVNFAFAPHYDGSCLIQYHDDRRLPEISADWDGLEIISFYDGDADKEYIWKRYSRLVSVMQTVNGIEIRLRKEPEHEANP